jgi:hypothetical protein
MIPGIDFVVLGYDFVDCVELGFDFVNLSSVEVYDSIDLMELRL